MEYRFAYKSTIAKKLEKRLLNNHKADRLEVSSHLTRANLHLDKFKQSKIIERRGNSRARPQDSRE